MTENIFCVPPIADYFEISKIQTSKWDMTYKKCMDGNIGEG